MNKSPKLTKMKPKICDENLFLDGLTHKMTLKIKGKLNESHGIITRQTIWILVLITSRSLFFMSISSGIVKPITCKLIQIELKWCLTKTFLKSLNFHPPNSTCLFRKVMKNYVYCWIG
ncbi:hypothetical protein RF11_02759 [Thelohanellus kitauei]|uniref:Uncharacterized protein n=1 Tax=Thelohanellus kitauei TaxID=669202 RepID=A0A0C2IJ10_THEKT|nr:hypothetical protein RF11_02759 [Thelohanellus kitauei]